MSDLDDNPMGLMGFEFIEFAAPVANTLEPLFEKMGFSLVAKHRGKDVLLYRQGGINFIVNRERGGIAGHFAADHGPSASGLAFRVRDAHQAYKLALERGAEPVEIPAGPMELRLPAIKGIGGAPLYLIDRFEDGRSIYDVDFEFLPGADRRPKEHGFEKIDHLTHNVCRGRMAFWGSFYERIFGFREIRFFDIQGEPVDELKTRGILLDGSTAGGRSRLLLQIFSEPLPGPVFLEFIQRKHDEGFGEGNFKALFQSLERDQSSRGALVAAQD